MDVDSTEDGSPRPAVAPPASEASRSGDQRSPYATSTTPSPALPGATSGTIVTGITRSRYDPTRGVTRRRTRSGDMEEDIARPASVPLPERPREVDMRNDDGLRPSALPDIAQTAAAQDRFPVGSAVNDFFVNLAEIAATESAQIPSDEALVEDLDHPMGGARGEAQNSGNSSSTSAGINAILAEASVPFPASAAPAPPTPSRSDVASRLTTQSPRSAAQNRSTELLTSLHDLRSNLQTRVESLGHEVERLRRRAEALERGIMQDAGESAVAAVVQPVLEGSTADQRSQAFRDANMRVRQLRLLRQQRNSEVAELRASTPVWGPPGSTSPGTGGRRDPSVVEDPQTSEARATTTRWERKRGSGVLEVEQGDRLWRRERRMALLEERLADGVPRPSNSSAVRGAAPPANLEQTASQRRLVHTDASQRRTFSADLSYNAFNQRLIDDITRTRDSIREGIRDRAAGRPAISTTTSPRTYTPEQLERLRHPARTFGTVATTADRESLTSRGRRVTDRLERSAGNTTQDRMERALPGDAATAADDFTRAQTVINNTLTRYRDALLSNGSNRLPSATIRADGRPVAAVTDSSVELVPELARLGLPAATIPQPALPAADMPDATAPLDGSNDYVSEILAAEDVTTSEDLAEDIPVAADPTQTGTGVSTGANLSRRVTLRFPPSRMSNTPLRRSAIGLLERTASNSAIPSSDQSAAPDAVAVTHDALNQLSLLSQTVTVLSERLDSARRLMRASMGGPAMSVTLVGQPGQPTTAGLRNALTTGMGSPFQEQVDNVFRPVAAAAPVTAAASTATGRTPRRPQYPASHTMHHPHHRPRIGPDPLTTVLNCDNFNSFDVNFDGNIIFRPAAAHTPHRELIARCLSMLPGGRDGLPSRWMRMTGENNSRPRRPASTAGFWVRWVSGPDVHPAGLRLREMQWNALPPIVAFQFAVVPPDDDPWVRADEVEFITPRSRLRQHLGPWMHSRVRIAPFENDPPIARWGTSAYVRQAAEAIGGLGSGDYLTVNLLDRTVEVHRAVAAARASVSRSREGAAPAAAANEVRPSSVSDGSTIGLPAPNLPVEAVLVNIEGGDGREADRWLNVYEPAISQIRAEWRAHYRLQGLGPLPLTSNDDSEDETVISGSERDERARRSAGAADQAVQQPHQHELRWSRDFLDADGDFLPPARANAVHTTPEPPSPRARDVGLRRGETSVLQYL